MAGRMRPVSNKDGIIAYALEVPQSAGASAPSERIVVHLPPPGTVPVRNATNVRQSVGALTLEAGEIRYIDRDLAAIALQFAGFTVDTGVLSEPQEVHPVSSPNLGEIRRAFWREPTPPAIAQFNAQAFPSLSKFFTPIEKAKHSVSVAFFCSGPWPLTGGIRVVGHLARYLLQRGHRVAIIVEPQVPGYVEEALAPTPIAVYRSDRQMPRWDYVVGTYYTTMLAVEKYEVPGRHKVGFIQGNEPAWPHFTAEQQATARKAFSLPGWVYITVAPHLAATCKRDYGTNVIASLPGNGVDVLDFSPRINNFERRNRVFALKRETEWKGHGTVMNAIAGLKRRVPGIQCYMAGFERWNHPLVDRYFSQPTVQQMASLYSHADVYLSASLFEGSPLPPLEAMACGCIPVVTKIGTEDYLVDGENGFHVEPNNPDAIVEKVEEIYKDERKRLSMIQAGLRTAWSRPWSMVAAAFEEVLLSL